MIASASKSFRVAVIACLAALGTEGVARSALANTLILDEKVGTGGVCQLAVDVSTTGQPPYDAVTFTTLTGAKIYLDPAAAGGAAMLLDTLPPGAESCAPPPSTLCTTAPSTFTWQAAPSSAPTQVTFSCCNESVGGGSFSCNSSPPGVADPEAFTTTVGTASATPAPAFSWPWTVLLGLGLIGVAQFVGRRRLAT
jgi:hypothetical protein